MITGVRIGKATVNEWTNHISQATESRIIPEIEIHTVAEKIVVLIRIKEFPIKPVSIKGRCFRRVGASNRVMTPQEIAQMHLHTIELSWDKLPARNATLEELEEEKVRQYIHKANDTGRRNIRDDEDLSTVLEKLELLPEKRPSWAAILLFRDTPQRLISQAVIHCGRFKEETIVIDDHLLEGTLIEQVEEAMGFMRKNMNVRFVMTGQPAREQIWDYPLEALREAIINAVCHRDYTIPSNAEVRMYDDRLIIWNPGRLPLGMTIEDLYRPHSSVLRNTGIGGVFYDIGWIEQWGSGIKKMREACKQAGLPEPLFEEDQGFRVTFRKEQRPGESLHKSDLNERQFRAFEYVTQHGSIRLGVLKSLVSGVSEKTLSRDLQEMTRKGILKASGVKRWRTYMLDEEYIGHLTDI